MLDLRILRYSVTLARCSSYAEAAEKLGISQPSLSRAIQQLEDHYQVRLFDRGRKGAFLTAEGRNLMEGAAGLLAHADNLEQQWASAATGSTGTLCFGMAPMPARALLADVLKARMQAFPNVQNDVVIGNADRLLQLLVDGRIEFFIAAEGQVEKTHSLASQLLGEFPANLIVRRGHPLMQAGSKAVCYPILTSSRAGLPLFENVPEVRIDNAHIVDDYDILVDLTLSSDAVLQTSAYTVARELEAGTLVRLPYCTRRVARVMFYSIERRSLSRTALSMKAMIRKKITALHESISRGE